MKFIKTFLLAWIDYVIANPTHNKNRSVQFLQTMANIDDANASAFFDELAAMFGAIKITRGNFKQLQKHITDDAGAAAKYFFENGGLQGVLTLPSTPPVLKALRTFETERGRTEIVEDIAAVKIFREAFTSADATEQRAVKRALKVGLDALRAEREELNRNPNRPQGRQA